MLANLLLIILAACNPLAPRTRQPNDGLGMQGPATAAITTPPPTPFITPSTQAEEPASPTPPAIITGTTAPLPNATAQPLSPDEAALQQEIQTAAAYGARIIPQDQIKLPPGYEAFQVPSDAEKLAYLKTINQRLAALPPSFIQLLRQHNGTIDIIWAPGASAHPDYAHLAGQSSPSPMAATYDTLPGMAGLFRANPALIIVGNQIQAFPDLIPHEMLHLVDHLLASQHPGGGNGNYYSQANPVPPNPSFQGTMPPEEWFAFLGSFYLNQEHGFLTSAEIAYFDAVMAWVNQRYGQ